MVFIKQAWDTRPYHHFNIRPIAGVDNSAALQTILDSGENVILPPGRIQFSSRLNFSDFAKLQGVMYSPQPYPSPNMYAPDYDRQTVLEWTGATTTNSVCINMSAKDPGVVATDLTASGDGLTDDLRDVRLRNITLNAGDADIGINEYRGGNGGDIGNVVVFNAKKRAGIVNGCFTGNRGALYAYSCGGSGWAIGEDYWGIGLGPSAVNNVTFERLHGSGCGLDGVFNPASPTRDGVGVIFMPWRGCDAVLSAELNDGYGIWYEPAANASSPGGNNKARIQYTENNIVDSGYGGNYWRMNDTSYTDILDVGWAHPSMNTAENLLMEAYVSGVLTAGGGATNPERWPILRGPGALINITSNTNKYRTEYSVGDYATNKLPGGNLGRVGAAARWITASTPTVREVYNASVSRIGASEYRVTFNQPFESENDWIPLISIWKATTDSRKYSAVVTNQSDTLLQFRIVDNSNTLYDCDTNVCVINVLCFGVLKGT